MKRPLSSISASKNEHYDDRTGRIKRTSNSFCEHTMDDWLQKAPDAFEQASDRSGSRYTRKHDYRSHPTSPTKTNLQYREIAVTNENVYVDYMLKPTSSKICELIASREVYAGKYQEDLPYTGLTGFEYKNQQTGANDYINKHNPAVLYDSVADKEDRLSKIKNSSS
ncbi:hypothetical protein BU24DRAFT_488078 [Aaosphaeria arxii CBS 175.79]|uniref:Uncharacterized protein n=1 Tax=Aaosphaeria arxii CBS 175.79 TaxID=1450172 RepID=A0A6A5Y8Q2_9PLEO|nr:uncharacterized protein BU24DRAFT_488078 [Aaosphaeria arxii CBS 175.79]KAF2021709.1 hypothetical protein BU24DRAFT_488078 [Aaosphaeria arxii CBS 175.79]